MKVTDRRVLLGLLAIGIASLVFCIGLPEAHAVMTNAKLRASGNQAAVVPAVLKPDSPEKLARASGVGGSCVSSDPDFLCLGLKYVVYADQSEHPIISRDEVAKNLAGINSIWGQCKIGFQVDEFLVRDPKASGLPVQTASFSDLDEIRRAFDDDSSLLVVTTYTWKRNEDLGHSPANAWTKMPGSGLYGVVLEQKVGAFPNIIAHELGHYLNLYHVDNKSDVMNAVIYNKSEEITPAQCRIARTAIQHWWPRMLRRTSNTPLGPQLAHEREPVPSVEGSNAGVRTIATGPVQRSGT